MRSLESTACDRSATRGEAEGQEARSAADVRDREAARNELQERGLADARRVEGPLNPVPVPRDRVEPAVGDRRGPLLEDVAQPLVVGRESAASETASDTDAPELRPVGRRGVTLGPVRPPRLDEAGVAQDREVVRDARLRRLEDPLDLPDLQLLFREEPHGPQPQGIRERGEGGAASSTATLYHKIRFY